MQGAGAIAARPQTDPTPVGRVLALPDGRRLGLLESGDPAGYPVFFFHGLGASRRSSPPGEGARGAGVRVLALDRPGIGLSDPRPERTLLSWAEDVASSADALGLDRFSIVGWSGGAAYALACAHAMPARVRAVAYVSGGAPLAGLPLRHLTKEWLAIARLAKWAPWAVRAMTWMQQRQHRCEPERFLERMVASLHATDAALLSTNEMRRRLAGVVEDVFRQGSRWLAEDGLVLARPWGFHPRDVNVPVRLWHGEDDTVVPPPMARFVAESLPNCEARFLRGEGHYLYLSRWAELLEDLSAAGSAAR